MSPLNATICTTISYTLWVEWYYLKNNYLTLRSKVKVPQRSLWYATHRLIVMYPHSKYNWPISKDKNFMDPTRKYYLKNNYLTLRSKVKIPRRSLQYVTHRLMVMHPHTTYNWPIWKDKQVMVRTSFAEKKQKRKKKIRLKQYVSLRSKGRHNNRAMVKVVCLTLYHDGQFYWWRKLEYPEKFTDLL